MIKSRTKSNIEIGEKLYVNQREYNVDPKPNLEEYKVTKVNTSSIYAESLNTGHTIRFGKDLKATVGMSIYYKAYLYRYEYWDMIEICAEMDRIAEEATFTIKRMSYEELKKLEKSLKIIKNVK